MKKTSHSIKSLIISLIKIYGFELDKNVCDQLNSNARSGVKYFPHALGEQSESRKLNITNHPMCSSLYEPNEDF